VRQERRGGEEGEKSLEKREGGKTTWQCRNRANTRELVHATSILHIPFPHPDRTPKSPIINLSHTASAPCVTIDAFINVMILCCAKA